MKSDGKPEHDRTACYQADGPPESDPQRYQSADYARLGDVIVTDMQTEPVTISVKLMTPESVAYGNYLITTGRWKLQGHGGS